MSLEIVCGGITKNEYFIKQKNCDVFAVNEALFAFDREYDR